VSVPDGRSQADAGGRSGETRLVKRGAGTLIIDGANGHTGGTVVEAGSIIVRNVAALGRGEIVVKAGATLVLDVGSEDISIDALVMEAGGFLDLGSGRITVAEGLTGHVLRELLHQARGSDDAWTSRNGIGSSRAFVDVAAGLLRGVGWIDDGSGAVTIGYAAPGDTNLDGMIDVLDLVGLLSAKTFDSGEAATWAQGDFNYDGSYDVLDLTELVACGLFDSGDYLSEPSGMDSEAASAVVGQEAFSAAAAAFAAFAVESGATPPRKKVVLGTR